MENADILRRFEHQTMVRKNLESTWQAIEELVMPYRGKFFKQETGETSVDWRKRNIYDSTAVMAHQNLASSIHGGITPPSMQWYEQAWREDILKDDQEAQEWLQSCGGIMFNALQDSNFNLEANETYMDLSGYGTSLIVEEALSEPLDDWEGLNFTSLPLKEAYFEQDKDGGVYVLYRLLNWPCSRYIDKFGMENCPPIVLDRYEQGGDIPVEVVFCIYPESENKDADVSGPLAKDRRPYQFKYITRAGAEPFGGDHGSGGYYEMPAFVVRWRKTSDSQWGNSPAMVALADILTLNQTIEMRMKAMEKTLDPPQKVEERALISDLYLQARGLTVMRDINKIAPIDLGTQPQFGEVVIEDLRQAIESYFFVDQLELKESPAMTATEVMARREIMQRLLGPTEGRIQSDFLDPMLQRTFNILLRAGRFPPMPDIVKKYGGEMDIDYLGPLSRAQKMDSVAATERWLMMIGQNAELLPEMLDIPDPDMIVRNTGRQLNVKMNNMRDEDDVKATREKRKEMQERQMEAEVAQSEGMADKAIGEGEMAIGATQQ